MSKLCITQCYVKNKNRNREELSIDLNLVF